MNTETHQFQAEVRQLLDIVINALYSDREIFVRELVSNASDALEKLRLKQLTDSNIYQPDKPLEITVTTDKENKTITIADTGIGMTEADLVENLGTIAHSGTKKFMEALKQKQEGGADLIGQFGVGFYSSFMVADRVEVFTHSCEPEAASLRWSSDGREGYSIETLAEPLDRGTRIVIRLKDEYEEFSQEYRVKELLRRYSNFVGFPLNFNGEHVNTVQAIWSKSKSDVKPEEYDEFYQFIAHTDEKPLSYMHFSADAPIALNALLFIPRRNPEMFGFGRVDANVALYCKRVLIDAKPEGLLPEWLRFLNGVVDSEDLPLNISRETLQENIVLRKISQTISKQILSHLEKMAKDDAEKYNSFWKLHGKVFKLGYSDFVNRDRITPLLRFNSSAMEDADGLTSLDDYISRARESQKEIWYVAAPSREAAKVNPHSEVFRRKGLEVLYLYEPVDEFALETLAKYKDYTFKAVEHADSAVLDAFADTDEQPKAAPLSNEDMNEFDKLLETIRKVLGDQIKDARVSHRLADSPACLVSPDDGVTSSMERLMRVMQKDDSIPQKIFEINRDHPLLRTMLKLSKADPDDSQLAEMIQSLFDSTLLLDGYIKDPHALASRATKLLEQASAWYADVKKL